MTFKPFSLLCCLSDFIIFIYPVYVTNEKINHEIILSDMGFYYLINNNKGNL